jgi:hypothetical protein
MTKNIGVEFRNFELNNSNVLVSGTNESYVCKKTLRDLKNIVTDCELIASKMCFRKEAILSK